MQKAEFSDRDLDEFLKALSSETRRRILFLFTDGRERTVNQIAEQSRLGQSTASEHLAILKRGALLKSRKEGKEVLYSPDRKELSSRLRKLADCLEGCCR